MNPTTKKLFFTLPLILFLLAAACHSPRSNDEPQPQNHFEHDSLFTPTGNAKIDSLLRLTKTGAVTEKMSAYFKLASEYATTNKSLSHQYAWELVRLAQQEKQKSWEGKVYSVIAGSFAYENHFDSAIFYYEKSVRIMEELKEDKAVMLLQKGIAQCLGKSFRFDEALKLFQECLDFSIKTEMPKENIARILQNIATLYQEMRLFDLSDHYYEQALNIFHTLDQSENVLRDIGCCYNSVGNNFFEKEEYLKSIEYQEKALEIFRQINNVYFSGYALNSLAYCYFALDKDEEAPKVINELAELAKTLHNRYFLFQASELKAKYHYKQREYKKSLEYAKEALSFVDDSDKRNIASIFENLALASSHAGTPHETAGYIEKMTQLKKEAFDEERNNKVTEMEIKYETAKKELKISALEKEKRLMTWLGVAAGAVLLMALAAFFLLWRWTLQKRRIAEQQRQLAETRILQLEQEKQLIAAQSLLDGETQERSRLARDLHDGLGGILAGAKLNLQEVKRGAQMDDTTVQRYETALGLLDESVREMRRLAHHLMPESLSVAGLKQATADFCNSIPHAVFQYYGAEMRFDAKIELMLYRIMHELVTNALKHSDASRILVQIVGDPDRIALTVQDNGCGFDPSTQSEGTGLSNIRARVAACNGNLMIDAKPGAGTEVNVEVEL